MHQQPTTNSQCLIYLNHFSFLFKVISKRKLLKLLKIIIKIKWLFMIIKIFYRMVKINKIFNSNLLTILKVLLFLISTWLLLNKNQCLCLKNSKIIIYYIWNFQNKQKNTKEMTWNKNKITMVHFFIVLLKINLKFTISSIHLFIVHKIGFNFHMEWNCMAVGISYGHGRSLKLILTR